MRVAVVFSALPADGGGVFTFEGAVKRGLDLVGDGSAHEFVLYASGNSRPGVIGIPQTRRTRYERVARRRLLTFQDLWEVRRTGRWQTWFQKSLDDQRIDVVWFASHYFEECEQPYVATVWDLAHLEYPWFPEVGGRGEWEVREQYFQRYLPRASRVIVPNVALEDLLVNAYPMPRARMVQIPFATPEWALEPHARDDDAVLERHSVRSPYLFYPAQFWAHKNHVTGLKVLAELNEGAHADERLQLALVGSDKGMIEHVRDTARTLGVDDEVRFLGFVEQDDLVSLYRRADALLYLSFFGPSNLPPLEAAALGCPIVCADSPGMSLQLGDAALYAPPTDVAGLAAAVRTVRADPATREHLVRAGHELAASLTPAGYVSRVIEELDAFAAIRDTWPLG